MQDIALFKALTAKMDYLTQRQTVISQNIANADTPAYRPQDLKPVDFKAALKNLTSASEKGGVKPVSVATTDAQHMPSPDNLMQAKEGKQKTVYEVAPVGNAVIMEEQMMSAGQTMLDYNLITNLYQKNIGLIRTALGRPQ